MNTKQIKSSVFMRAAVTLLLTVLTTTGTWAQTYSVSTEKELNSVLSGGNGAYIRLSNDIQLGSYLNMNGRERVTIDLNGHKLYRSLDEHRSDGHVIYSAATYDLKLISSEPGGSIEGGMANNGGAIYIQKGSKVTAENVIFRNNSAADHAGAIWNNGTFTATNCTFENNSASDVGAIYNSVTSDGAGTATLTGCTFTGNEGTTGAGALANALGATVMNIDGCTIKDNTASSYGGGIWNGGTLNMKGKVTVAGNKKAGDMASNVFLKSGKVITVTGSLSGSNIGVALESTSGTFTSGFNTYNSGVDPATIFNADLSVVENLGFNDGEACLTSTASVYYVERSWDETNKQVVNTMKTLTDKIAYGVSPLEGQYKEVTGAEDSWFQMGGYSNTVAEYYVVNGNVTLQTIVVLGKDVHLILCNNATLTLTGGLKLEDDHKLHIHCQSYAHDMGRLMVTNSYKYAAGIGSAQHEGKEKTVGELVIHGGHIEATGGKGGAGIGACAKTEDGKAKLCNIVTVYGGYVQATGNSDATGIGGGDGTHYNYLHPNPAGDFILYDGTVIAKGDGKAAGVGGGFNGYGGNVIVHGGTLIAYGGESGAGIGSGKVRDNRESVCGGTVSIYGGTVTAIGGKWGAGIGGGYHCGGANVYIYGGTVTATGGYDGGAGIGGGHYGHGMECKISGGNVTATAGRNAAGIGGGVIGQGGNVTITGGTVTAKGGPVDWSGFGSGDHESRAIGCGAKYTTTLGTLVIGDLMMVGAGTEIYGDNIERIYNADERVNACWYRPYAVISPCTHPESTYTINGSGGSGTHTLHCSHCTTAFTEDPHEFDETGECTVCHYKGTVHSVTIYLPNANDDDTYATDGDYKSYIYNMVDGTSFTLPGAPQDLQYMKFAGWLVTTAELPHFSSYKASDNETLQAAGAPYTLNGDVTFVARYKDIDISLADSSDDYETIYTYDGKEVASVTLTGRTFYKDGKWNTLCLPFAVTDGDETDGVTFSGTPLEGATVLTLDEATLGNSTLTFNFKEVTTIEPGKPYIFKWDNDSEHSAIVNPVFHYLTICNTSPDEKAIDSGIVYFKGHYALLNIGEDCDLPILYLGNDNTFRYPDGAMNINAFRACLYSNANLGDVNDDGDVNVTDVTLLVNHILGKEDENFVIENADVTRDGDVTVTDVTALVNLILGGNSILNIVVNGADGLTFGGGGYGPARTKKIED